MRYARAGRTRTIRGCARTDRHGPRLRDRTPSVPTDRPVPNRRSASLSVTIWIYPSRSRADRKEEGTVIGTDYETLAAALEAAAGVLRGRARAARDPENDGGSNSSTAEGPRLPLLLKVEEAAGELRVGRGAIYELIRTGELESVQIGRSRRIPRAALVAFVKALSD